MDDNMHFRKIAIMVAAQGILCRWNIQLVDQRGFCPYAGGEFFLTAIPSPMSTQKQA